MFRSMYMLFILLTFVSFASADEEATYYRLKLPSPPLKGRIFLPTHPTEKMIFRSCEGQEFKVSKEQIIQVFETCSSGKPGTLAIRDEGVLNALSVYAIDKNLLGDVVEAKIVDGRVESLVIKRKELGEMAVILGEDLDVSKKDGKYSLIFLGKSQDLTEKQLR